MKVLSRTVSLLLALVLSQRTLAIDAHSLRIRGAQSINTWRLRHNTPSPAPDASLVAQSAAASEFPVFTFTQPLDHFFNSTNATFEQRYWVSTRHYTPGTGAPVIVIDGGETSGEDRLVYLDTGIGDILAKATGGVAVVLEHRYYGESVGVQNFTTDSLRWLNNTQALEDSANFMRNVKLGGIDEDLTAPNTPWIYYGGSYAGARSAIMKVLYPDIVYGAIASSGVTHAALSNWEYMDVIRTYADPICSANLVQSIATVDRLLNDTDARSTVKGLFNLTTLESDQDFASVLNIPLGAWQEINWDPTISSTDFDDFCTALNANTSTLADTEKTVTLPGNVTVNIALLSYADYMKTNFISDCLSQSTAEECYGTNDDSLYQGTDLSQTWRLWTFQYCTQWGFLTTAPPDPAQFPPIISRVLDLEYEHKICVQAFPPGEHFTVPPLPDVESVDVLGDYDIAADRLAIIDGEQDPWRPNTPHSQYGAKNRTDTIVRPFKLIPGAVHHWDENGLANSTQEPPEIQKIHREEIEFVQAWLADYNKTRTA
ncbi:peptidase S28 [Amylostereum chailletii]|nr:peptidase S28 [Amylostereum chailletii]